MAGFLVYCAIMIPASVIFDRRVGFHRPTALMIIASIVVAEAAKAVVGGF